MTMNAYTVAVGYTFMDETQYLTSKMDDEWRKHNAQSWKATPFRPPPIDQDAIEAHFQRVLARFKRREQRRAFRSTSPGCCCWHSPTTPSPWAAEPVAAVAESQALYLLNNCQASRQIELRMAADQARKELEARFGTWGTSAVAVQQQQAQQIDWPAPPPPPRPYSPSPTPWMEPSPVETTSCAAVTETERRVEGIPIRISRMARRRMVEPRSSYTPVPTTATTEALLPTLYGPPPSYSYHEGAGTTSAEVIYQTSAIPRETPTEPLRSSLAASDSRVDWLPSWSPIPGILNNTARQHGVDDRLLHAMADLMTASSESGATYGGRSPVSRGLHTPEEVMPWTERRVNYGFGTWVIHGPSDVDIRRRPVPCAVPAQLYHESAGLMRYEESPPRPTWGYIQQEEDEEARMKRMAAMYRKVLMENGLWETLGRQ